MELETFHHPTKDQRVYTLVIEGYELSIARLSVFDKAVIADCTKNGSSIADNLLAIELMARRIEESQ